MLGHKCKIREISIVRRSPILGIFRSKQWGNLPRSDVDYRRIKDNHKPNTCGSAKKKKNLLRLVCRLQIKSKARSPPHRLETFPILPLVIPSFLSFPLNPIGQSGHRISVLSPGKMKKFRKKEIKRKRTGRKTWLTSRDPPFSKVSREWLDADWRLSTSSYFFSHLTCLTFKTLIVDSAFSLVWHVLDTCSRCICEMTRRETRRAIWKIWYARYNASMY